MTSAPDLVRETLSGTAWELRAQESRIGFQARTCWGLLPVRGRLSALDGRAQVSAGGDVTAGVVIDAASIDSANAKRDKHLRSDDFLAVERHPTITIDVDGARLTGTDSATASGRLTVAGRTVPVPFDLTFSIEGSRAVLDVTVDVDRTDFGLTFNFLGMLRRRVRGRAQLVFERL